MGPRDTMTPTRHQAFHSVASDRAPFSRPSMFPATGPGAATGRALQRDPEVRTRRPECTYGWTDALPWVPEAARRGRRCRARNTTLLTSGPWGAGHGMRFAQDKDKDRERGLLRSACGRRPRSHAHLKRHPLDNPIDTRRLIRAPDVCPSRHLIRGGQILVLGRKGGEASLPSRFSR